MLHFFATQYDNATTVCHLFSRCRYLNNGHVIDASFVERYFVLYMVNDHKHA